MTKVKIDRLDHQGRGIGYINNKIVFIENSLPGEIVDIDIIEENKNYNIGKVISYDKLSEKRVKPFCPYYEICGGCKLQHLPYQETIDFKKEKIKNIFEHSQLEIPEIIPVINEKRKNYRNKLSVKIQNGNIGFYEEKSHNLVEIKFCELANESINKFLEQAHLLNIKNGLMTIRVNYNNELLIVIETEDIIEFKINDFKDLKIVGVILNGKTIYGNNFFYERMNKCLFKVSHDAFFQINPYITSELFNILEENLNAENKVLDLYSGVGTLGIIASKKAKEVYSIEIVKNAVLDNIENKKLNKSTNVKVFLGSADQVLKKLNTSFDSIIVDPPRKGLDKSSLNIILNSNEKQIIYISCDPMTLARDLKELTKKYRIEKYYLLDMFSFTYHVESMVILKYKGV